jgi:selenophosphate synthase
MSTNDLSKMNDRGINEDSAMSNSTNNSFTDTLIQDITKIKNTFLISKANNESKIVDILLYLQSDTNLAINLP